VFRSAQYLKFDDLRIDRAMRGALRNRILGVRHGAGTHADAQPAEEHTGAVEKLETDVNDSVELPAWRDDHR